MRARLPVPDTLKIEEDASAAITLQRVPTSNPHVDPVPSPLAEADGEGRYATRALLGEGGMGEVRLCRDRRIGRDVAMKVIRAGSGSHSDARARFEREARVQGQLEHPAIVPVYDLGVGAEGAFFTMKRLRGQTLEEILADPERVAQLGTRKLLSAFAQVCQAIAFAHARGVLHRDLKPANVMLGDYGEVWVLDWGVAKLIGAGSREGVEVEEAALSRRAIGDPPKAGPVYSTAADETVEAPPLALQPAGTAHGVIMGTPGYMAPEQVRGDADLLDARTDVYALGAILFELLTLVPLHDRAKPLEAVLLATLQGADARASVRAPNRDVPPELEAIAIKATALAPDDRYESVRAMVADVERYLDGDRDLAQRRTLAAVHAERALHATSRAEAMREVNRALALDPNHRDALAVMVRLLVELPPEVPKEAEVEYEASLQRGRLQGERMGAWAYLSWFTVTPLFLHMGVRSWPWFFVSCGAIIASFVLSMLIGRRKLHEIKAGFFVFWLSTFAVGTASLIFGPYVLVSAMTAINALFFVLNVERGPARTMVIAASTLTVLIPVLLEQLGLLSPAYVFHDGVITILPRMASFPAGATHLFLLASNVALILVPTLLAARMRDGMRAVEKRVFIHNWYLRQLLPDEAHGAAKMPQSAPRSC